jgi:RimJ/RimL family protein N-acetyltransferase
MRPGSLETSRLRLEPWNDAHAQLLVRLSAMPEVMRHIGTGEVWPSERAEQVSTAQRDHWATAGFGWRAAIEKATGTAVGFIALNRAGAGTPGLAPDEHEIGWWLLPEAWGRGLAREGALAVRDDALRSLGAPGIVARIQPSNRRSIEVAKSLGLAFDFTTTDESEREVSVYRLLAGLRSAGAPLRS